MKSFFINFGVVVSLVIVRMRWPRYFWPLTALLVVAASVWAALDLLKRRKGK